MKFDEDTAPMSVDDIFCPPDGAMQFHILRSHLGEQDQSGWVMPLKTSTPVDDAVRLPGCTCTQWFEIIRHDNPVMEQSRLNLGEGQFFLICACFGRIEE